MERREFFKGFAASLAAVYSLPQIAQALSGYLQELADDLAAATDPAAYWARVSEEFLLSSGADSLQLRQYRRHASGDRRGSQGLYRSAEGTELADAQQFYSRAALFVGRLPSRYGALAVTCEKLAGGFYTYRELLRHMAAALDSCHDCRWGRHFIWNVGPMKKPCRELRNSPSTRCSMPTTSGERSPTKRHASGSLPTVTPTRSCDQVDTRYMVN